MTTAKHHAARKNVILSILMVCAGYGLFNLGDAGLKMLAGKFHFSQIMLTLSVMVLSFMVAYGWHKEGKKAFSTKKPKLMFFRAFLSQITGICNIFAFPHVHLTTFYTLVFTAPLWVALLSSYFLKDRIDSRRLGVILFGFAVILFIFRPGGELMNIWSFLVLLSALAYACQMVLVRHIGSGESRPFMYMYGSLMSMAISLPFIFTHYLPPTPYEWGLFLMMAVTGSIGLLCISYAFQEAPSASVVAPYHYTQIIWGALLGYYIFNEKPGVEVMIGAVLIILAGLYLIHRETRQAALKPVEAEI
jgi:S-adenosylmethionine uptake transporter